VTGLRFAARVTRAPFLTATLVPVLLGACVAYAQSGFLRIGLFLLTLVGALAVQVGLNMSNDYHDHLTGNDAAHPQPTPFSGGSRVIQEGLLQPGQVLAISAACYLVGAAIGLYLARVRGWPILAIGVVGMILAYQHNAPPLRLAYHGHGLAEVAVGIGFGPLMVAGTYYVQVQRLDGEMLLASLPVALLIAAVLTINTLPDIVADRSVDKKTLAVVLGPDGAIAVYAAEVLGAYLVVAVAVVMGIIPLLGLLALLPLPIAIRSIQVARRSGGRMPDILPANAATIQLHLFTGLLLCLAYALAGLLS
jgi:1,4-dihydroxy-2-naphthoate polyprenyltransferase